MRKLALTIALLTIFGLPGSALAALPVAGDFTGITSAHGMNGFHDLVTFVSANHGRSLRQFQFGTLGCMGTGTFPVGVDPFAQDYTLGTIPALSVSTKGAVLVTTKPSFPAPGSVVTSVTIKADFTSSKAVNGTIAVSQTENGSTCTASTMKFSAVPGTPQSLGYEGP
jgi:hypothetical protein